MALLYGFFRICEVSQYLTIYCFCVIFLLKSDQTGSIAYKGCFFKQKCHLKFMSGSYSRYFVKSFTANCYMLSQSSKWSPWLEVSSCVQDCNSIKQWLLLKLWLSTCTTYSILTMYF